MLNSVPYCSSSVSHSEAEDLSSACPCSSWGIGPCSAFLCHTIHVKSDAEVYEFLLHFHLLANLSTQCIHKDEMFEEGCGAD